MNELKMYMNQVLELLPIIRNKAIELNKLDSQEFLDYQDTLNEYSLDPDRI